ncbi:MAG: phospholipid carrier-dependent glycosyltransferase, partial [Planctomycetes bacterium]|nr:phospholipid carrier-dependent glycosyltransferase [Planctomycetota bacterium]
MAAVNAQDAAPVSVPPAPRGMKLAAAALLLLSAALALWSARAKSEAYDEPMYILTGYSYVVTGDLSLNREHPPLAKYLIGLPLLLLDLELPPDYQSRPGTATAFIAGQTHAHPREILFLARVHGVLLLVLLGLYAWRWGRVAFGEAAGLAALALVALNPGLIGLSVVAGNDFAVTAFGFAACYHAWRWLASGARTSLLFAVLLLGCAVGSKFTALLLLPVVGLAILAQALRERRPALLGWGLVALLAVAGVLWLLYLGEARSLAEASGHPRFSARSDPSKMFDTPVFEEWLPRLFDPDTKIPLLSFLKGLDLQFFHASVGHPSFWHGQTGTSGWPEYYAGLWLIKNPEAFTLLLLLGLLAWRRTWRGLPHELLLLLYPLLLFVVFSRADVQLGFKYVLPVVPFLAVAAARWLAAPLGAGPRASPGEARAAA